MLDAVRGGLVDGIVAWHPDRLHRSPRELEDFLTLVEQHRLTIETVRAGAWDLSTPSGRMTARILGSVARGESEHKSDRVRRALEQHAELGRPHGRVAYGWQDRLDILAQDRGARAGGPACPTGPPSIRCTSPRRRWCAFCRSGSCAARVCAALSRT